MVSYCYCYCCWANILENTHAPVHYGDILGNLSSSAESSTNHPHSAALVELANVMGLFPRPTHMPICNKIKLQSILSSSGMPNKYLMKCLWINTDERASECNSRDSPQRGWCATSNHRLYFTRRGETGNCALWRRTQSKEVLSIDSLQGHEIGNHRHHQLMAFLSLEKQSRWATHSTSIHSWWAHKYAQYDHKMGMQLLLNRLHRSSSRCWCLFTSFITLLHPSRVVCSVCRLLSCDITMHIWWVLFTRVLWNVSSALLMMQTAMNFCFLLLLRRRVGIQLLMTDWLLFLLKSTPATIPCCRRVCRENRLIAISTSIANIPIKKMQVNNRDGLVGYLCGGGIHYFYLLALHSFGSGSLHIYILNCSTFIQSVAAQEPFLGHLPPLPSSGTDTAAFLIITQRWRRW